MVIHVPPTGSLRDSNKDSKCSTLPPSTYIASLGPIYLILSTSEAARIFHPHLQPHRAPPASYLSQKVQQCECTCADTILITMISIHLVLELLPGYPAENSLCAIYTSGDTAPVMHTYNDLQINDVYIIVSNCR